MADASYEVVYRAVADFSKLHAEVARARKALKELCDEQKKCLDDQGGGSGGYAKQAQEAAKGIKARRDAEQKAIDDEFKGIVKNAKAREDAARKATDAEFKSITNADQARARAAQRERDRQEGLRRQREEWNRRQAAQAAEFDRRESSRAEARARNEAAADTRRIAEAGRRREEADRASERRSREFAQRQAAQSADFNRRQAAQSSEFLRRQQTQADEYDRRRMNSVFDRARAEERAQQRLLFSSGEAERRRTAQSEEFDRRRAARAGEFAQRQAAQAENFARRQAAQAENAERRAQAAARTRRTRSTGLFGDFGQFARNVGRGALDLGRRITGRGGGGDDDEPPGGRRRTDRDDFFGPLASAGDRASRSLGEAGKKLFSFRGLIIAAVAAAGPLVAILGSLGAVALGVGNVMVSLTGVVAALPGLFGAAALGIGALVVAFQPLQETFKAYQAHQKAAAAGSQDAANAAADAADKVRNSSRAYAAATRANRDAIIDERRATEDLNLARRDAYRELQDLRTELERSSLNEQSAVLSLKEAQESYRRTIADANATQNDRERAAIRVKEAENDLEDVRTRNVRLANDVALADSKGVEGSDRVVSARRAAEDATLRVAEAADRLVDAQIDLKRAQDEQRAGGAQALKTLQDYQRELAKLSPSTRAVFEGVMKMGDAWKTVQRNVSERLFKPVVGQLDNLKSLLPTVDTLLGRAADAMGELAAKAIAMFASDQWKTDLAGFADTSYTVITNLGDAALAIFNGLRDVEAAARPFTIWISEAIKGVSDQFAAWAERSRNDGSIASFLDDTKDRMKTLWGIAGDLFGVISSLYTSTKDFTSWMLTGTKDMTQGWQDWADSTKDQNSTFRKWLEDMKPLLSTVKDFIGAIADAFTDMAKDPRNIKEAQTVLGLLAHDILPKLVEFFGQLAESGSLEKIVIALGKFLDAINGFLANGGALPLTTFLTTLINGLTMIYTILNGPGGKALAFLLTALTMFAAIAFIGKWTGLTWLAKTLYGLHKTAGDGVSIWGRLRNAVSRIGDAFSTLRGKIKSAWDLLLRRPKVPPIGNELATTPGRAPAPTPGTAPPGGTRPAPAGGAGGGSGGMAPGISRIIVLIEEKVRLEVEMNTLLRQILAALGGVSPTTPRATPGPTTAEPGAGGLTGAAAALDRAAVALDRAAAALMISARAIETAAIVGGIAGRALPGATRALPGATRALPGATRALPGATRALPAGAAAAGATAGSRALPGFTGQIIEGEFVETTAARGAARAAAPGAAAAAGAATAARAATRPGLLARAGLGGAARAGGFAARAADPLAWIGLATGMAADYGLFGKRGSTGKQLGQAGGAMLTGAGIGATIGSVVPGIGTLIGGAVGAGVGGAYSLYKDKGLRQTVAGALQNPVAQALIPGAGIYSGLLGGSGGGKGVEKAWDGAYEGFMRNVGSPVAKWFREDLPKVFSGIGTWFTVTLPSKVGEFFGGLGKWFTETVPNWINDNLVKRIEHFFTVTLPRLPGKMLDALLDLPGKIADAIGFTLGYLTQQVMDIGNDIQDWWNSWTFEGIWDSFWATFVSPVVDWAANLGTQITDWWNSWTFEGIWNSFYASFIGPVWDWITNLPQRVTDWWNSWTFEGVWNNFYGAVIEPVGKWFGDLPGKVADWWHSWTFEGVFRSFYNSVIAPIGDWIINLGDSVADWWNSWSFEGIWNGFKNTVINPIVDFLKSLPGKAKEWVGDLWDRFIGGFGRGREAAKQQSGGVIEGPNDGKVDSVPIWATVGEFMVRKAVVDKPGAKAFLNDLNEGRIDPQTLYAALDVAARGVVPPVNVPAAGKVGATTINTTNSRTGMQMGDVIINNPIRERSDRSMRRTLQTLAYRDR